MNYDVDGEILADTSVDDEISMEMPSSLFDGSTPTFESEDDFDFTCALLLLIGFTYIIPI